MSSSITTANTAIPMSKMVNDLFLQWLSLPETRSTLSSALHSVRTNSKMPDPIPYSKIYSTRGGFSKSQHFDSPPVSPVPRLPSSPRVTSSTNLSSTEMTPNITEEKKSRSSRKVSSTTNGNITTPIVNQPEFVIEKTVTTSKQTPTIQPRSQSPKKTSPVVTSSPEPTNHIEISSIAPVTKTPISPLLEPVTPTTPKLTQPIFKQEEKTKKVEIIPKFYFPSGQVSTNETLLAKQLKQAKEEFFLPKQDKLHLEDFGKLAQLIGLSLYWKAPLFRACAEDALGSKCTNTSNITISHAQFETFWRKVCKTHHDKATKFVYLLAHSSPASLPTNRQYVTVDDWDYLVQDIIDTHPGLKFLREAREFHSRYIKTVVARVFYNCNRSWSMKLTVPEIRRSNFIETFDQLEVEEDINRIHDYFSYEHFYVIYCKFWELDSDHDLFISREDLAKHNGGAISSKMIDRIFSGAVSNSSNIKEGKMSYYEFVWFLISEEDKRSATSIEYWFRCLDLDGDGILSMYELDYFYQEQVHKMEIYGIEYMPLEDCICQMLDLVKPEEENKIRLKDLKRCKLTNVFFDTFFNLEKYLENEQKDPFSNPKDPDSPEVSDWVKYAESEYDNLTHEDGGNDNLDDANYDEDFEDDDNGGDEDDDEGGGGGEGATATAKSAMSSAQRITSTRNANADDLEAELKRWKD